jgi:hypothetical protein
MENKRHIVFVDEARLREKPLRGSRTQEFHYSKDEARCKIVTLTCTDAVVVPYSLTCNPTRTLPDGNQGAGHANHTHGNGAEVAQDPLSLPSGPITRLRAKRFKEALNGLIQENWADSKNTKMGSNNNQGLVHVIKALEEDN